MKTIDEMADWIRQYADADRAELIRLVKDRCLSGGHDKPDIVMMADRELLAWLFVYDNG
jgi:hypothetical protein